MDPTEIDLDQIETIDDVEEVIGGSAHPAWMLACQIPKALGVSIKESAAVKKDSWTDEDEAWKVYLNGSGEPWYPTVATVTDRLPNPCRVEVFAGSHLVMVDEEAVAILHPDQVEFFVDEGTTKPWEAGVLHALRDRLVELGMDLPHVDDLAQEVAT